MKKRLIVLFASLFCALFLFSCEKEEEHVHNYLEVVDDNLLASKATCTSAAKYFKVCECGDISSETFFSGEPLGHDYSENIIEPTCLTSGYTTHTCSRCNDTYTDNETLALGHKEIVKEENRLEATLTSKGSYDEVTYCEVCNEKLATVSKEIPKLSCVFNQKNINEKFLASEASCEHPATYYYSCICGEVGTETFTYGDPLEHQCISLNENVIEATCSNEGSYDVVKYCVLCEKEIDRKTISVDKIAHNYSVMLISDEYKASEATCTSSATYYYACECGAKGTKTFVSGEPLNHDITLLKEDEILPTCTSEGKYIEVSYCNRCKKEISKKEVTLAKLDHTYNTKVISDEYKASEATCTEASTYYYSCECGAKGTETFANGEPLNHLSRTYEENRIEPTHFLDGSYDVVTYCDRCQKEVSRETYKINRINHTFNEENTDEEYLAYEATCTSKASYYYSCECGAKGSKTFEYGSPLGHTEKTRIENEIPATLTSKGSYDEVTYCEVCQEILNRENIETSKLSCIFDQEVVTDEYIASEATCTSPAKYYYSCECGEKGSETFEYGTTIPHTTFTRIDNYIAPTYYSEGGYDEITYCSVCRQEISRIHETIAKETMLFDQEVVADKFKASDATCTSPAKYYYSSKTGQMSTRTFEYGSPLGHTEKTRRENEISSTHFVKGSYDIVTYCDVCQEELARETFEIEKLPCSFTLQVVSDEYKASDADCYNPAKYYYSCECGEKGNETFDVGLKLDHQYEITVVEPTPSEDGYTRHTCIRCSDTYDDNIVPKLGYTFTLESDKCEYLDIDGSMQFVISKKDCYLTFNGQAYPKDGVTVYANITFSVSDFSLSGILYYHDEMAYLSIGGLRIKFAVSDINDIKDVIVDCANKVLDAYGIDLTASCGDLDVRNYLNDALTDFNIDKSVANKLTIHFNDYASIITLDYEAKELTSTFSYGQIKTTIKQGSYLEADTSLNYLSKNEFDSLVSDISNVATYASSGNFDVNFASAVYNYSGDYAEYNNVEYYIDGRLYFEYKDSSVSMYVNVDVISTTDKEKDYYVNLYFVDNVCYASISHCVDNTDANYAPLYLKSSVYSFFDIIDIAENALNIDLSMIDDFFTKYYPGYKEFKEENPVLMNSQMISNLTSKYLIESYISDVSKIENGYKCILNLDEVYGSDVSDVTITLNYSDHYQICVSDIYVPLDEKERAYSLEVDLNSPNYVISVPQVNYIDISSFNTLARLIIKNLLTKDDGSVGIKDYYHFSGSVGVDVSILSIHPDVKIALNPNDLVVTIAVSYDGKSSFNKGKFTTYISVDLKKSLVYMCRVQKGEIVVGFARDWSSSQYKYTYRSMTIDEFSDNLVSEVSYIFNFNSTITSLLESAISSDSLKSNNQFGANGSLKDDRKYAGWKSSQNVDDLGTYVDNYSETINSDSSRKYTITFENSSISDFLSDADFSVNFDSSNSLTTIDFNIAYTVDIDGSFTYGHEQKYLTYEDGRTFEDLKQIWAKDGYNIVLKTGVIDGTSSDLSSILDYVAIA